jgi:hypothetical protein
MALASITISMTYVTEYLVQYGRTRYFLSILLPMKSNSVWFDYIHFPFQSNQTLHLHMDNLMPAWSLGV